MATSKSTSRKGTGQEPFLQQLGVEGEERRLGALEVVARDSGSQQQLALEQRLVALWQRGVAL